MLEGPAFTGMPAAWWAATAMCARATMGDGAIALAVFAIGALLFRDWRWFALPEMARYATVVRIGVILQVVIEWAMVYRLGRWGYKSWHPLVPALGVGVLPILQRVALLPLVFWALGPRRAGDPARLDMVTARAALRIVLTPTSSRFLVTRASRIALERDTGV